MSAYQDIRDAIVTRMESVAGIANVHARQRYAPDWSSYLDLFKSGSGDSAIIHGWLVSLANDSPISEPWNQDSAFGTISETYRFTIQGMYQLNDSQDTETTFFNLVELVRAALRNRMNLGQSVVPSYSITVDVKRLTLETVGNILCHFCEMTVTMQVRSSVTFG